MSKKEVMDKINKFAEKHNVLVYYRMPEGWKELKGAMTAPAGTTWITNGGSIIKKTRRCALLLDEWYISQLE